MAERLRDFPGPDPAGSSTPWRRETDHRGVVLAVCRHELRQAVGGWRFRAAAILIVFLTALAAASGYRGEVLERRAVAGAYEARLAGATVGQAMEMLHPAIRPPWKLAPVVEGGQLSTPDLYEQAVSPQVSPELRRIRSANPRLPSREPLDWMFVIRVVLSLAAFLLGYDAVCGERRQGTLKLALTYPAPRWKLLAGKLLALWTCLAAPFLAGAALSLALAAGPGGIPFTAGDLARAGLVALVGLWAAAFFGLAALLVSSSTREASASLSLLVWIWVTVVIVVPAGSGLLAHRLHPLPTDPEIARETAEIQRRIARDYPGLEGRWRRPEWAAADGFAWERASAAAENRRFALREELRRRVLRSKLDQARLARNLAALSPGSLATGIAERLTGSGLGRDESFLEQAWAFRSDLAGRLRALDARDPASPHILYFGGWVSVRKAPPGGLPRFAFREQTLSAGLAAARPALVLFALETLLLAAATLFIFSRYDAG